MFKNKILLVLSLPPPYGGGEIRNKILFEYFNMNEDYICFNYQNRNTLKRFQGKFILSNITSALKKTIEFNKYMKEYKPKIVYMGISKNFLAFLRNSIYIIIARYYKSYIVGDLAGRIFYFLEKDWIKRKIGLYFLKKVKTIRILGKQIKDNLNRYGIYNTKVMFNGVYVPEKIIRIMNGEIDYPLKFLYVGALAEYKGIEILIETFKNILKSNKNVELHLIGSWHSKKLKANILRSIEREDLLRFFKFHGEKKELDKWEIFQQCHVYVHPSKMDGQPLSILEAYGCGMPVISTRVGGIPDIVEDNVNGYLLSEITVKELEEKICLFLNKPQLIFEMSKNNVSVYKEKYTAEKYCKSMKELFEEIQKKV